jgi:hypothetical protein
LGKVLLATRVFREIPGLQVLMEIRGSLAIQDSETPVLRETQVCTEIPASKEIRVLTVTRESLETLESGIRVCKGTQA